MNPAPVEVADTWQAADAIIPLKSEGGRTIGVQAHLAVPYIRTLTAGGTTCPPGSVDTAPIHMSRTRSSLPAMVLSARHRRCSHRRTGKRPWAFARSPDGRISDM